MIAQKNLLLILSLKAYYHLLGADIPNQYSAILASSCQEHIVQLLLILRFVSYSSCYSWWAAVAPFDSLNCALQVLEFNEGLIWIRFPDHDIILVRTWGKHALIWIPSYTFDYMGVAFPLTQVLRYIVNTPQVDVVAIAGDGQVLAILPLYL